MTNVVVTGGLGFVGQHLITALEKRGDKVFCFDRKLNHELLDYENIRNFLDIARPAEIYHLAAQAYVPESIDSPIRAFEQNTLGSVNLLKAVKNLGIKCKIHMAGTSEEYGDAKPAGDKVAETDLPNPMSPYAISKLAMENFALWYAKTYGLDVVVTRAFNHSGAGRGEMYAESSFAKQIVEIERGKQKELRHGNLESVRNYTDVRDVVRAYMLAINLPSDVYNICSENNVTMQDILDGLIKNAKVKIKTKAQPALYRKSDFSFSPPSCEKFTKLTEWKPQIRLEGMLLELLMYWRNQ